MTPRPFVASSMACLVAGPHYQTTAFQSCNLFFEPPMLYNSFDQKNSSNFISCLIAFRVGCFSPVTKTGSLNFSFIGPTNLHTRWYGLSNDRCFTIRHSIPHELTNQWPIIFFCPFRLFFSCPSSCRKLYIDRISG